jgi:hypothetical protein
MMLTRAPWFLAGLVGSALLLVVVVGALAWRQGPGPLVRSLDGTDSKTTGEYRFPADFGRLSTLVPFAGGINPVAAAVVPEAHGPEYRDADWVKAQAPEAWTLQVLASQDERAVKRFLGGLENRGDFVYFAHPQDGQVWYVVTTGAFSSRELALGVAGELSLPDGAQPFPRSLSTYQSSLQTVESTVKVEAENTPAVPVGEPDQVLSPL